MCTLFDIWEDQKGLKLKTDMFESEMHNGRSVYVLLTRQSDDNLLCQRASQLLTHPVHFLFGT